MNTKEEKHLNMDLNIQEHSQESFANGNVQCLSAECSGIFQANFMTMCHIGEEILLLNKKLLIHLRKFVHVFMGRGNELHIAHQEIVIQMFRKTVYYSFYWIPILL